MARAARRPRRRSPGRSAAVDATLSWLVAAERLAKAKGVKLFVALAPVGVVDPDYVDFWQPWSKYFSYQLSADARHRRLAADFASAA